MNKEISDCPCATCQYREPQTIHEMPCHDCAAFGVVGYPRYKPIAGLLEPEKFVL